MNKQKILNELKKEILFTGIVLSDSVGFCHMNIPDELNN